MLDMSNLSFLYKMKCVSLKIQINEWKTLYNDWYIIVKFSFIDRFLWEVKYNKHLNVISMKGRTVNVLRRIILARFHLIESIHWFFLILSYWNIGKLSKYFIFLYWQFFLCVCCYFCKLVTDQTITNWFHSRYYKKFL